MLGELCQPTGAGQELFHKFMMNATMEMSKSNRRKQSKPNRLFADEEHATTPRLNFDFQKMQSSPRSSPMQKLEADHYTEDKDPMDLTTKAVHSPPAGSLEVSESPRLKSAVADSSVSTDSPNAAVTDQMEMVNFPCHTCGKMFPSRALQEQHISEHHSSETSKTRASPSMGSLYPTAYHRLATELGLGPLPAGIMAPLNNSSDQSKTSASSANNANGVPTLGTPGVGGKGSAGTVFQREAYCEICQREFCNKYFLKTHKANIHGIVDPGDLKMGVMSKSNTPMKINNTSPKQEPAPPSLQKIPNPNSAPPAAQKSSSNESMEDFCEICQKHFCNKYYLKKHKVDVHNIRYDGSRPPVSGENVMDGRGGMPHISPVSSAGSMPHLPMMVPSLNNLNPTSINNMLFVSPFGPSMAAMSMVPPMMQHQFFMPPNMSNLAAAHAASQVLSTFSPEMKNDQQKMPMIPMPSLERGESMPDSEKTEAFCNICRANKHGIVDDAAVSAALMMSIAASNPDQREQADGRASKMSATSPVSSTASNPAPRLSVAKSEKYRNQTSPAFSLQSGAISKMDTSQSMPSSLSFDAMLAAKQADRITCDICNKEVCNKYFLKAHKWKMHGISTPGDDKRTTPTKEVKHENANHQLALQALSQQQQQQQNQQQQSKAPQQMSTPTSEPTISHLIKLGIDPEAYCFLCKKEFCSKSFLKTHKLTMHGLNSDKEPVHQRSTPKGTITPPTSVSPVSAMSPAQATPVGLNAETFQWRWKENSQEKTNCFTSISDGPANAALGNDRFTWRWKEPANATRVFCDLCNKELCNKYFLRTHKLNKHGITDTSDMNPTLGSEQGMLASSMMADLARASHASAQNNNSMSAPQGTNDVAGEYGNKRWAPFAGSHSSSPTEMDQQAAMRDDVCQVCGIVFEDMVAVNEHIRLEHSDESFETPKSVQSRTKDVQSTTSNIYNCSQCPYKTSVWEKLNSHEACKHNADKNTCQTCHITFGHIHMLVKHMKEIHDKDSTPTSLQMANEKEYNTGPSNLNLIKCNYCPERFPTKQLRKSHIRSMHKNKTMSSKFFRLGDKMNKLSHTRIYACDKCNYTCSTVRNLRFHQAMKHKCKSSVDIMRGQNNGVSSSSLNTIMQEFSVHSVSGAESIAKGNIMLPVYKKISGETTVKLTLVPSKLSN